jgi:hypothetical protein
MVHQTFMLPQRLSHLIHLFITGHSNIYPLLGTIVVVGCTQAQYYLSGGKRLPSLEKNHIS